MGHWLVITAVLSIVAATAAQAQMKGLAPADVASLARSRAVDFRISQELGNGRPVPLIPEVVLQQGVAPNAFVGVGLASVYGRKKGATNLRLGGGQAGGRKPAVTFVLKF
jgi:hypothetical protein